MGFVVVVFFDTFVSSGIYLLHCSAAQCSACCTTGDGGAADGGDEEWRGERVPQVPSTAPRQCTLASYLRILAFVRVMSS